MADWQAETDVLVVGSGGGALTGAYTAAREGQSVIVVEASDRFGGTTAYSGGGMWFPCNAVLTRNGHEDTLEEATEYYRSVVGDRTPVELQDAFLRNGAPLVDYLESDEDWEFLYYPWPDYFGKAPQARAEGRHIMPMYFPAAELGDLREVLRPTLLVERSGQAPLDMIIGGQALIGRLLIMLTKRGVDLRLNTRLTDLVVEDGRVVGAVVDTAEGPQRIRARKGVLLAAGGFDHNQQMRDEYGVPGQSRDAMGPQSNQGDAIRAGIAAGADIDLMEQAWWSPGLTHPDGSSTFSLWFTGGLFVNGAGERFVNESWPYDRIGRVIIDEIAAGRLELPFWMIYDNRNGERPPLNSASVAIGETEDYVQAGLWHSADTLAELAEKIGVPAEALEATVARFNEFAAQDSDTDFGRGDEPYDRSFAEGGSPLVPVTEGLFHAAAFGLSDLGTKGGLRTDATGRVLRADDSVIEGLYAAGNTMAAPSGHAYPGGGNPIGTCMVFSWLAAKDMAGVA